MARILLIDRDIRLAAALSAALRRTGYRVRHVQSDDAMPLDSGWDLVLVDPDSCREGLAVCRRLRRLGGVGIVILTAATPDRDRVVSALRSGADDCLTKPFSFAELHARLEAVRQRVRPPVPEVLEVGTLRVDLGRHQAFVNAAPVELTRKELQVLAMLARRPGVVVGRDELVAEVWPALNGSGSRTLDVHVATLRTKIKNTVRVEAIRGVGYRIVGPAGEAPVRPGRPDPRANWQLVVISPHFDDAVLSAAGLVQRHAGQVAVVTVLGGVPAEQVPAAEQDRLCGFTTAAEAARVRAGEDVRACQLLDADPVHLPHVAGPDIRGALAALTEFIGGLPSATAIVAPAGIGADPAYARVRETVLRAWSRQPRRRVGLYPELLAAAARPWDGPPPSWQGAETTLQRIRLDGDRWRTKHRAVCAYASQLGLLGSRTQRLLANPGPLQHEAIWWIGEPAADR